MNRNIRDAVQIILSRFSSADVIQAKINSIFSIMLIPNIL